jgi:hypothetical protein
MATLCKDEVFLCALSVFSRGGFFNPESFVSVLSGKQFFLKQVIMGSK